MARSRTLVMVLAGGAGGRLGSLTDGRAKPAVPFAGTYRLIDFPLSNCRHSGLSEVWVTQQFNPVSLTDHLSNGRPWDLDRTYGGLLMLSPRLGEGAGWQQGTADSLWRNAGLIRQFDPEAMVVVSADAVYRLDYAEVVADHHRTGADVTMVTARKPREEASRYGVVQTMGDGRITSYAYKPDEPQADLVTTEVFVFRPSLALDLLDEIAEELGEKAESDGLGDLGDGLLPRLVDHHSARDWRHEGYWQDVGTVASYWQAHQELLGDSPSFDLDDRSWPVLTSGEHRSPAFLAASARVTDSLVSQACRVHGTVERSVLAPGVVVEEGATVRGAVVLHDAVIRAGAVVEQAVLDDDVRVEADARVGRAGGRDDDGPVVTLVGRGRVVEAGTELVGGDQPD